MRLYLDVETYRRNESDAFTKEKVVAICVLEDWSPYEPGSANIDPDKCGDEDKCECRYQFFTERELGSEEKVIKKFYEYLLNKIEEAEFVVVTGFNILRFDIPLLIQKGIEYKVEDLEHKVMSHAELNKLWHNTFTIDYFQVALPLSDMKFKGLTLANLIKKARQCGVEVECIKGSGKEVKDYYEKGEYDKIKEHCKSELKALRIIDLNYGS